MAGQVIGIRRWGFALVALSLGSCGNGDEEAGKLRAAIDADPVLKQYLTLQEALAGDRPDEATAAIFQLAASASGKLRQVAASAEGADVDSVRVLFQSISEHLIERGPVPEGLRVASCPMAFDYTGARWIQHDGEIANPYFGAGMLRCGVFADGESGEE